MIESEERRASERKPSPVNRLQVGELRCPESEEPRSVYLFVVDLSEGGLRINLDRELPADQSVRLRFPVDTFGADLTGELDARYRVVWNRCLAGGTWVHGLEFLEPAEETVTTVQKILRHFREGRPRERFRTDETLRLLYYAYGVEHSSLARNLSAAGVSFRTKVPLKEDDRLLVVLPLRHRLGKVKIKVRVVWLRPLEREVSEVGCEFTDISEEDANKIQEHIDRSHQQQRSQQRYSWEPPDSRSHLR